MGEAALRRRTGTTHGPAQIKPAVRWLRWIASTLPVVACVALVALVIADSLVRQDLAAANSEIWLSEIPPGSSILPPGAWEENLILPHTSMDARWWVIHARRALESGEFRVRHTAIDNFPDGREVHWSSSLVWLLVALSGWRAESLAWAAMWAGPVLLVVVLALLGGLALRAFGWPAAAAVPLGLLGAVPLYLTFQAGEADHHGLVAGFAASCVLCLVVAIGFCSGRTAAARRWAMGSGICGAAALWVSASTTIPVLAGIGFAALALPLLPGSRRVTTPGCWTVWGVSGGLASLFFYCIEYFPEAMGWRLEGNHPVWAAAWAAGGWLIEHYSQWLAGRRPLLPRTAPTLIPAVLAMVAILIPAVLVLLLPDAVFWVRDPFLLALHQEYIHEFRGILFKLGQAPLGAGLFAYFAWPVVCAAIAGWALRPGLAQAARAGLLVAVGPALVMQALALWQIRWYSAAMAMWIVVAVAAVAAEQTRGIQAARTHWLAALLGIWGFSAAAISLFPQLAVAVVQLDRTADDPIEQHAGGSVVVRDLAHRLLQVSADGPPVVLSGPNVSTELAYHGGIRVIGTLYWENKPGLKSAAEVFAAGSADAAQTALRAAGVTHILIPAWDNFGRAYSKLWFERKLQKADDPEQNPSFLQRVVDGGETLPRWLRPLAYPIPAEAGLDAFSVKLYAFLPEQTEFESKLHQAIFFFETDQLLEADELLRAAQALDPDHPTLFQLQHAIELKNHPTSP